MKTRPAKANTGKGTLRLRSAGTLLSLAIALLVLLAAASNASGQVTGGTWTAVATPFPGGSPDQSLLLTDGTVIVQDYYTTDWWRLKPDQYGDYSSGTWKQIASLPPGYAPVYYGSAVLPNGKVIIEGGEYGNFGANCKGPNPQGTSTNCGAIYDPVLNMWTAEPPPDFGDSCGPNGHTWCVIAGTPTVVFPDGTFMMGDGGYLSDSSLFPPAKLKAFLTPPYTGSWMNADPFNTKQDSTAEEGWTLLPSLTGPFGIQQSPVMTVNTYSRLQGELVCNGYNSSELFVQGPLNIFALGTWYCLGDTPQQLYTGAGNEMGPAILRPDGTVFQAGADKYTAILNPITTIPPTNQWTSGPVFPIDSNGNQLIMDDGPAALLPNGNVLMMASPCQGCAPSTFLELTPGSSNPPNQLVVVSPFIGENLSSNHGQMLLLPTGQVLLIPVNGGGKTLEIYTPTNQAYDPSWAPQICNGDCDGSIMLIGANGGRFSGFSGKRFNGMSQAAAFGDEYQSATNYPLVRLTFNNGLVFYCRTHDHSSMGVATGDLSVSTNFDCPPLPGGASGVLQVVANGIPSNPQGIFVVGSTPPF